MFQQQHSQPVCSGNIYYKVLDYLPDYRYHLLTALEYYFPMPAPFHDSKDKLLFKRK